MNRIRTHKIFIAVALLAAFVFGARYMRPDSSGIILSPTEKLSLQFFLMLLVAGIGSYFLKPLVYAIASSFRNVAERGRRKGVKESFSVWSRGSVQGSAVCLVCGMAYYRLAQPGYLPSFLIGVVLSMVLLARGIRSGETVDRYFAESDNMPAAERVLERFALWKKRAKGKSTAGRPVQGEAKVIDLNQMRSRYR